MTHATEQRPRSEPSPSRASRIAGTMLTTLGVLLLAFVIYRTGLQRVLGQVVSLGPWFPVILLVSTTWFLLNTLGWRVAFEPQQRRPIPFRSLLRCHLISEAISNTTPFMSIGGEPLKVVLLRQWATTEELTASVVNDNIVHLTSAVAFVVIGLLYGQASLAIDPILLHSLWLGTAVIGVGALALVVGSRFTLATRVARFAAAIRPTSNKVTARAARIDHLLSRFVSERPASFAFSFILHLAGRMMGTLEAWLILRASGVSVSFGVAVFLIAVLHVMVNLAFSFVTGQYGVQETAATLLFAAVGLDPSVAVAMVLARRVRGFFWIGVGLVLLGRHRRVGSRSAALVGLQPQNREYKSDGVPDGASEPTGSDHRAQVAPTAPGPRARSA